MQVRSLGQEDPLEEKATHSHFLAWTILWTEEPGGLQSMQWQRVRHDLATEHTHTHTHTHTAPTTSQTLNKHYYFTEHFYKFDLPTCPRPQAL